MSITSARSYEMRIARKGDEISDPPQPYWHAFLGAFSSLPGARMVSMSRPCGVVRESSGSETIERLLADKGANHVACLLAYALNDLDKAQGKA